MLKSYAGRKITWIMKKTMVKFVSVESNIYHCLLFWDPSLVMSDGVLVWPNRACSRWQAIPNLWLSPSDLLVPTVLPCCLSISPGPRSGSVNQPRGLPVPSPPVSSGGLQCDWEGGHPVSPSRGTVQSPENMVGVFPCPLTTHLGLSQILSNNIWFLVN